MTKYFKEEQCPHEEVSLAAILPRKKVTENQQIILNPKESESFVNALLGPVEIPQKPKIAFFPLASSSSFCR